MNDLIVTKLRVEDGVWRARLTADGGRTLDVDREPGSWRITPRRGEIGFRELLPTYAAELQRRVRSIERKTP